MALNDLIPSSAFDVFDINKENLDKFTNLNEITVALRPAPNGLSAIYTLYGMNVLFDEQSAMNELLAEQQREQFEQTFSAQFAYVKIGNISDYVGDTLTDAERLNSYRYPDDSGEWYGPIQSQTFPIAIPANPAIDSGWAMTTALTVEEALFVAETSTSSTVFPTNSSSSLLLGAQSTLVPSGVDSIYVHTGSKVEQLYLSEAGSSFSASAQEITDISPSGEGRYVVTAASTYDFLNSEAIRIETRSEVTGLIDISGTLVELGSAVLTDQTAIRITENGAVDRVKQIVPPIQGQIIEIGEDLVDTSDGFPASALRPIHHVEGVRQQLNKALRCAISAHVGSSDLNFVILGDSTECGVGGTGGPYGQTTTEVRNGNGNRVGFSMISADPNFIGIDPQYLDYRTVSSDTLSVEAAYPAAGMVVNGNPKYETKVLSKARNSRDKLTVYYHQRTADTAARAVVTVYDLNDVQIAQDTLDSYTTAITFGTAGTFDVGGRIAKFTLDLDGTYRGVRVVIDQLDVVDRGNGLATNGTLMVHGFTLGEGIAVHNLAVSSSTLTAGSADNIMRGIDTPERVSLAKALDADLLYIGWGTNDSKDGVTTLSQFKDDYRALIDDLKSWKPSIKIILATDPLGLSSLYANNPLYHNAIRDIAIEKKVVLFDVEEIFKVSPPNYYADGVHPSAAGYQALHYALCNFTGIVPFEYQDQRVPENRCGQRVYSYEIPSSTDTSGNFVSVLDETLSVPSWARGYQVTCHINVGLNGQDLEECAGLLELNGIAMSEQVVNAAQIGSNSVQEIVLGFDGDFQSVIYSLNVNVLMKNYGIRVADSASKVTVRFV